MKGAEFLEKINEIDADLIEGAAKVKIRKINYLKAAALLAACVCLAAGAVFGIKALMKRDGSSGPAAAGGTDGKLNVTAEIKVTGTENALSLEEAQAYLNGAGGAAIKNELESSDVKTKDLHFSPWGVSILRSGDSGNFMASDWRQFLAYSGDELVAIIDLNKEKDSIHHGIAFGGPWFPDYQALLKAHTGEELVMIYVGDVQAVVTPENQVLAIHGGNDESLKDNVEEGKDYYHYFKMEQNTFIP